jgi:hypothetical protein
LNDNNFSAPVPEFFADFKNLTSLEVSSSGLNGKFPEKIFQVPTLQMLDLSLIMTTSRFFARISS